ncbi:MAG: hypothetical protein IK127_05105 [Clostridia bacterium]|nr:hypothetical protein [Clostridia bacterium]
MKPIKPIIRFIAFLLTLCLPACVLGESACRWEASVTVLRQSEDPALQAVFDLLNAMEFRGTWAEKDGAFDLTVETNFAGSDAKALFTLGGVASHWQLTSPLLGDVALMFNNPAMIEFGNKIRNHLGLPLEKLTLLYPYAWENALEAPLEAFRTTFLAEEGTREIPTEDCVAFAEALSETAETDRAFSNLLMALGEEEEELGGILLSMIQSPSEWVELYAPHGIRITVEDDRETWAAITGDGELTFLTKVGGRYSLSLPKLPWWGCALNATFEQDGENLELNLRLGARVNPKLECNAVFDFTDSENWNLSVRATGTLLSENTLVYTVTRAGETITLAEGETKEPFARVTFRTADWTPSRWPDWTAEKVQGRNFYSLDDSTLTQLIKDVAAPMVRGLVPLIAAAPTSAVTALMDWLEEGPLGGY